MDTSGQSEKYEYFRRQRRNLIAASIISALYKSAELTFPEINLLGNKIKIENPEIVSAAIVIAFLYFFWRYHTACTEINGTRRFLSACHMWAVEQTRLYVVRKHVRPQIDKYESAEVIEGGDIELTFRLRRRDHSVPEVSVTVRQRFWFHQLISFIPTSLQTSNFSEYVLPYALALIAGLELFEFKVIEYVVRALNFA